MEACPRCGTLSGDAAAGPGGEKVCLRCLFGLARQSAADLENARVAEMETVAGGPPAPEESAPPAFPNYEVLGVLGRGGMGVVYKARQRGLERVVALKVLRTGIEEGEEATRRFLNEARAAARLQHAHIVSIHEVSTAGGLPYFSMDYVEGPTLGDWLRAPGRTPAQAAAALRKVALAVHHAHEAGIVHRDLKPGNILVDRAGEPKVTDFGIAKDIAQDAPITKAGMTIGTPCYMSPEQAAGENDRVGPRSDVYALGALLYEALARRPPFAGSAVSETLRQVLGRAPAPPSRYDPAVPRALEAVCLRALEKDPTRRHSSALAFAEDLGRFLEGRPVAARPRLRTAALVVGGLAAAALAFALLRPRPPAPETPARRSPVDELAREIREARGEERKAAAASLLELGPKGVPAWRLLLADPNPDLRRRAAQALGYLGAREAVPDLVRALRDADLDVGNAAMDALAFLEAAEAATAVVDLLRDPGVAVRRRAGRLLGRLKAEGAVPSLVALLSHDEARVRESAADTLGLVGARGAVAELRKLLADEYTGVRQAALRALAALEATAEVPAILALLRDEDGGTREAAASALGRLGAKEAAPELARLAKEDPSGDVRSAAEQALKRLEEPR